MHGTDSKVGDWALVELAEAQEGLLRHGQLHALGLTDDAIDWRLRTGRLHRRHRGVYPLGHRLLGPRGAWLAAAWSVEGSVLSHRSAAAFYGWISEELREQHVTTTGKATSRPGLVVHRVEALDERDVQRFPLLAVTRRGRTLLDLAAILSYPELRAIVDRVRTLDLGAVRRAQLRAPRKRGSRSTAATRRSAWWSSSTAARSTPGGTRCVRTAAAIARPCSRGGRRCASSGRTSTPRRPRRPAPTWPTSSTLLSDPRDARIRQQPQPSRVPYWRS